MSRIVHLELVEQTSDALQLRLWRDNPNEVHTRTLALAETNPENRLLTDWSLVRVRPGELGKRGVTGSARDPSCPIVRVLSDFLGRTSRACCGLAASNRKGSRPPPEEPAADRPRSTVQHHGGPSRSMNAAIRRLWRRSRASRFESRLHVDTVPRKFLRRPPSSQPSAPVNGAPR
jgi:hypothetical protein